MRFAAKVIVVILVALAAGGAGVRYEMHQETTTRHCLAGALATQVAQLTQTGTVQPAACS
jgi:hypothetical protein